MADGSIHFDTRVDTKGVIKAGETIKKAFRNIAKNTKKAFGVEDNTKAIKKIEEQAIEAERASERAKRAYDQQIVKVDELKRKLAELQKEQAELAGRGVTGSAQWGDSREAQGYAEKYDATMAKIKEAKENIQRIDSDWKGGNSAERAKWQQQLNEAEEALKQNDKLENEAQKAFEKSVARAKKLEEIIKAIRTKISTEEARVTDAGHKVEQTASKAQSLREKLDEALSPKRPANFGKAMGGVKDSAKTLGLRMKQMAKRVLIFSVILKALHAIKNLFSSMMKTSPELANSFARIKGNLLTAFQPIWETVLPALVKVVQILEIITARMAQLSSAIFGKNTKTMSKNAKALHEQSKATDAVGKSAEKASKSLAGFDEINQLGSDEKSGAGGASGGIEADFSGTSDLGELDRKTALIASYGLMILGTVLLVVGIATVNIPMLIAGIALVASGLALGNNSGAFGSVPSWVNQVITWGLMIMGAVLMVVGILTVNIPMAIVGIALMGVGAGYGKSSGAFAKVPAWVNQIITWGTLILGVVLVIVGIAIVNIPLIIAGLALIGVGVAYGKSSGAFSQAWEAIKGFLDRVKAKLSEWWASIKNWWNTSVKKIFTKEYWLQLFERIRSGVNEKMTAIKNGIKNGFESAKNSVSNAMTNMRDKISENLTSIKNKFKNIFNGIMGFFERFINSFVKGINWLVGKLNGLFGKIPDSIYKAVGFQNPPTLPQVQQVKLPRLAQGTVIPANYGEFGAILGDNRRELEVVSPKSTMKQAFKEAMAEMGGNGVKNITLMVSNRAISEAVIEYVNGKTERLGVPVIKGV